MLRSRTYLATLRLFLLFLFVTYYSNNSFFYHTHVVDGELIVHSHFFKGFSESENEPIASHSHSGQENTLIQTFNQTGFVDGIDVFQLATPFLPVSSLEAVLSPQNFKESTFSNISLRAPPQV